MSTNFKQNTTSVTNDADDDEGDDSSGGIILRPEQLENYSLLRVTRDCREGQKKFGPVPDTQDPDSVLGRRSAKSHSESSKHVEKPKSHPVLEKFTQQFSGDDPKMTPVPSSNSYATEHYPQLRAQNQLRKSPNLGRRKTTTFSR